MKAAVPAFVLILSFLASTSQADTLSCTLKSGKKSETITLDLSSPTAGEDGVLGEQGVYDLSFHLLGSCEEGQCFGNLTIYSQKAEDEVGQTSFEFTQGTIGKVFSEPLTGAPDKRKYDLSCTNQP